MTKIYSISSDIDYDDYGIPHEIPDEVYYGMSMGSRGEIVSSDAYNDKLRLILVSKGKRGYSDFVCGDSWIVVREKLRSQLAVVLDRFGQWINVEGPSESFFYFRVNNVIDILDLDKSKYNQITAIYKRLIKPAFKINDPRVETFIFYQKSINSKIFVNEEFKKMVELYGLKGLSFTEYLSNP